MWLQPSVGFAKLKGTFNMIGMIISFVLVCILGGIFIAIGDVILGLLCIAIGTGWIVFSYTQMTGDE